MVWFRWFSFLKWVIFRFQLLIFRGVVADVSYSYEWWMIFAGALKSEGLFQDFLLVVGICRISPRMHNMYIYIQCVYNGYMSGCVLACFFSANCGWFLMYIMYSPFTISSKEGPLDTARRGNPMPKMDPVMTKSQSGCGGGWRWEPRGMSCCGADPGPRPWIQLYTPEE